MKRLYESLPNDNRVVTREVNRISRLLEVKPPRVEFWSSGKAKYEPDLQTIYVHSVTWAAMVDPECSGPCYWGGIILHEFAHYLADIWYGEEGHNEFMYALQTALILLLDFPLGEHEKHELHYKPGAFRQGKRRAGQAILEDLKGEPLWQVRTRRP